MLEEKKDEVVGDPIKLLLEESLAQHREEMMNNFAQILRRLPTKNLHLAATLEAQPHSRYKLILTFLYSKVR